MKPRKTTQTHSHRRSAAKPHRRAAGAMLAFGTAVAPARVAVGRPDAIRPFQFRASEKALADLRRRIVATRWPDKETVADASQGVQLATMQKLAQYWASKHDWRKV